MIYITRKYYNMSRLSIGPPICSPVCTTKALHNPSVIRKKIDLNTQIKRSKILWSYAYIQNIVVSENNALIYCSFTDLRNTNYYSKIHINKYLKFVKFLTANTINGNVDTGKKHFNTVVLFWMQFTFIYYKSPSIIIQQAAAQV